MIALLLAVAPVHAPVPSVRGETPTAAVAPAQLAAATRLVELLRIDATLDAMFLQLSPTFAQGVIGIMATDARSKATIDRIVTTAPANRDRMVAILAQEFLTSVKRRYPLFKSQMAQEYAAAFTPDELAAIIAFYTSGPGAKALAVIPQMQAKLAVAGQAIGQAAGEEAGRRGFERIVDEMLPQEKKPAT